MDEHRPPPQSDEPPTVRLMVPGARADVQGATAITPNRRAARALGAPHLSLEGLARRLLRARRVQLAPELARWHALRRALEAAWQPEDVDGTARVAAGALREVLRAGLDESAAGLARSAASPRLARLVGLAEAYRAGLAAHGMVDPAEALWRVARLYGRDRGGAAEQRQRLHVCGYPRIGAAEVAFLAAVASPGTVLDLPFSEDPLFGDNRRAAGALEARGWRVAQAWLRPQVGRPGPERERSDPRDGPLGSGGAVAGRRTTRAVASGAVASGAAGLSPGRARGLRFPSRDAEARYVLTEVKRLLAARTAPEDIVLVARDDASYGPLLASVAWEYGLPLVASYALPLAETPVGAWTRLLSEAVRDEAPFEATARLLAHPLADGFAPGAWERARSKHPRGVDAWSRFDVRAGLLAWPPRASRAAYLERLQAAWAGFGVERRARLDAAGALAFQRLAAAAEGLPAPEAGEVPLGAFLYDLDALLRLVTVPAGAGGPGVELHTPLSVYGARYRHVFVLGAAEGTLPRPVADDPVLDFAERRAAAAAGLPIEGPLEAARREELSFRAVLWTTAGAGPEGSLTLTCPEDLGIPSPYFAALGIAPVGPGPKRPASDEESRRAGILGAHGAGDAVLAAARRAWAVERSREDASAPDAYDGVVGEPFELSRHVFSATQLLELGQCAFRWLARVPLKLVEPEEAEDDVSPLLRGSLYHRVLERALRQALASVGEGASTGAVRAAALAALDDAFARVERELEVDAVPGWTLRRGHHLRRLGVVLQADSFLPEGAEVLAVERRFPEKGAGSVEWRGLAVRGTVDRVDRRSGGLVLVDYKTGSGPPAGAQDDRGKARVDVQLPLYLEAAAPALYPGQAAAGAQYYSLTKAAPIREVAVDPENQAELDRFVSRVRAHLASGAYPVAPDVDQRACATCAFDLVCRKGPRVERMRGASSPARFGEPDGSA